MRRLMADSISKKNRFLMEAAMACTWSGRPSPRNERGGSLAVALVVLGVFGAGGMIAAQQPPAKAHPPLRAASAAVPLAPLFPDLPAKGQQTFGSAQAAVDALVVALKQDDSAALARMLGSDAQKLLSSGDAAEDKQDQQQFLDKYAQMHRLVTEGNGLTTLFVGAENWPAPIPLAHRGHLWYFDTPAGEKEVLYRRIGENELTVVQICDELVDAENQYHAQPHDGSGVKQYAQKMVSSPGREDGLYWQVASGGVESPLGPMLAAAEAEGYPPGASLRRMPFHGYYYRILKAQGAHAPGGAKSYLSGGKMTAGFAFLAYPAQYRSSGVMTFLVGSNGVVYQKDLGPQTEKIAKSIAVFDPDRTWQVAD